MSVDLLVRDGSPHWYLSPDIWVVPGVDPTAPPGSPIAGQPAYLWARVANNGSTAANGVRVDFYWANPALQVTRSNATFVGSAFGDVGSGETQEILCLVPWMPVIVNDGHECLVAVANHPGHPLPDPLPDAFDPRAFPQVAQKNLTVLVVSGSAMMMLTVAGLKREDKTVMVAVELGGELDRRTLEGLGVGHLVPSKRPAIEVGLTPGRRCIGDGDPIGRNTLQLRVARGTNTSVQIAVRVRDLGLDEYQLIRVVERTDDGRELGGLGLVVIAEGNKEKGGRS